MSASDRRSEYQRGAIRVVPETAKVVALCLEGDFDHLNARDLDAQIDLALDGENDLILDFSEASFVDSSVIHVVLRAARKSGMRQQTIVLEFGSAAHVERVLGIANIDLMLPCAHDRQEALRMIQQQAASV